MFAFTSTSCMLDQTSNSQMACDLSFAQYFGQEDLSDVDIVIKAERTGSFVPLVRYPARKATSSASDSVLKILPAHKIILSPYFKAQVSRWLEQQPCSTQQCGTCGKPSDPTAGCQGRPQVTATVRHPTHLPAALAVLSALYGVKPLPQLLGELDLEQQLAAALLADMWELPAVSTAAVQLLADAASSSSSHSQANLIFQALCDTCPLPGCLVPLFSKAVEAVGNELGGSRKLEQLLLAVLGDLEGVWADKQLQEVLLGLPLTAMEVLLGSNKLTVACEDTVLYTAHAYTQKLASRTSAYPSAAYSSSYSSMRHPSTGAWQAAERLAKLVRCPQLSQFWLAATAVADKAAEGSRAAYTPHQRPQQQWPQQSWQQERQQQEQQEQQQQQQQQRGAVPATPDELLRCMLLPSGCLQQLLLLRAASPSDYTITPTDITSMGLAVPDSWREGPRAGVSCKGSSSSSSSSSSVSLNWRLDVSALKQMVQDNTLPWVDQSAVLQSDDSPPFRGLSWRMQLFACVSQGASSMDNHSFHLQVLPVNAPGDSYYMGSFALQVAGWEQVERDRLLRAGPGSGLMMSCDPFGVGVMRGGWDEVKWAGQGLPATGCVTLTLKLF